MNSQEFVICIHTEVLKQNLTTYKTALEEANLAGSSHRQWKNLSALYSSLNEQQRKQLEQGVRQIMVDTIANILGVLDGTCILENYRDEFHLTYGSDAQQLNGDLQDYFLAAEQRRRSGGGD